MTFDEDKNGLLDKDETKRCILATICTMNQGDGEHLDETAFENILTAD